MSMQMQGMNELLRQIEQLGRTIDNEAKEKALKAGAEIFKEKAKENAPVKTGTLRENIAISDVDLENNAIYIGIDQQGKAFYGHIIELGAKHMPAQPYLGPAYENNKEAVQNKMAEIIRRELGL